MKHPVLILVCVTAASTGMTLIFASPLLLVFTTVMQEKEVSWPVKGILVSLAVFIAFLLCGLWQTVIKMYRA